MWSAAARRRFGQGAWAPPRLNIAFGVFHRVRRVDAGPRGSKIEATLDPPIQQLLALPNCVGREHEAIVGSVGCFGVRRLSRRGRQVGAFAAQQPGSARRLLGRHPGVCRSGGHAESTRCTASCSCAMARWWRRVVVAVRRPTPPSLYSLSKSFTSTAVGLAVAEGEAQRRRSGAEVLPRRRSAEPSANLKAMRVRDLLRMSTGQQQTTWRATSLRSSSLDQDLSVACRCRTSPAPISSTTRRHLHALGDRAEGDGHDRARLSAPAAVRAAGD